MEKDVWTYLIQQAPVVVVLAIGIWSFVTGKLISGVQYRMDIERLEKQIVQLREERDRFLEALLRAQDASVRSTEIAKLAAEAIREALQPVQEKCI